MTKRKTPSAKTRAAKTRGANTRGAKSAAGHKSAGAPEPVDEPTSGDQIRTVGSRFMTCSSNRRDRCWPEPTSTRRRSRTS